MYTMKRSEGTPEWSRIHPALVGPSDLERGYIVTTDPERAKLWARADKDGQGSEDSFKRDEYVAMQAQARLDHAAWTVAAAPTAPVIDYGLIAAAVKVPTVDDIVRAVAALPKPTYTATPN